jgi:hypothetical protein
VNLATTIDAVVELLQPLVAADVLKRVSTGPREQLTSYPAAWVWYGPMEVRHETTIRQNLERISLRQIRVSLYVKRSGMLPMAYMALVPVIDASVAQLQTVSEIDGVSDRFLVTGYSEAFLDVELDAVTADVLVLSEWNDADTYINDWR